MALLDGKKLSKKIRGEIKNQVVQFTERFGRAPALDVVLVGQDPASQIYVRNKGRACRRTGITSNEHRLSENTTQADLLTLINKLNNDNGVDGILVQLPLPGQIEENTIIQAIDPDKDVDGFHPVNLGRLLAGDPGAVPCTPLGCIKMLEETGIDLSGKNAVVIGRSTIVGKPISLLLQARHATVTMCHSRTKNLAHKIADADVVIAAAGSAHLVKGEWIKKGAAVIDVGINRLDDGTVVGDVEFEQANQRAAWITPVPGGVGPMTIACLLVNTLEAGSARLSK